MELTNTLAFSEFWEPPTLTFSKATTLLGLIRTARWFVGTSTEFGPTLYFISQFDSSLEKYFDDFVLNGKKNLEKIWGQCIGCPSGPDATARDIVQYIARGQIKTLACYDAFPSLSNSQIEKQADWYTKTQNFQRAVAKGDGKLEEIVDSYLSELAKPYEHVRSVAAIDTFIRDAGCWRRHHERVEEVCWSSSEIRHTLRQAGFDRISAFDATPFFTGDSKIHPGCRTFYLARKSRRP